MRARHWRSGVTGGRNWLRIIYLTNCSAVVLVIIIYVLGIRWQLIPGLRVNDLMVALIDYAVLLLAWFLIDAFSFIDDSQFLSELYRNNGLRLLDLIMVALPLLVVGGAWHFGFLSPPLWMVCVLMLVNAVTSYIQLRDRYGLERLPSGNSQPQSGAAEPFHPPAENNPGAD
jgi:hypothetical protein